MAPAMLIVVADTPEFDQGDTAAKPRPVPSAIRINPIAAEANAPAMIAAQETADSADSLAAALTATTAVSGR
jgi:hypothetical protein